ncbi:Matrix-remodeling-associated protein 5 [Merluccius polli]|uniref:Matrix-remodeling-associated protein 5 n=1 Tax=Merluccius polli TaxID=89951 RepID=A0AA47NCS0_MERPO|nr:Matrix-remodeling-associated protein 5 [Merluccius polli]
MVQTGMSMHVHCSAKGEPEPVLKWTIPAGVHVKPSQFLGRRLFVFPNGTLYVRNVALADGGRYECLAKNAVGIAKRTIQLIVRTDAPPFPLHPPPTAAPIPLPYDHQAIPRPSQQHLVSAMYGSTVFLHCPESTGSSRGTIWQLPSKAIMEHQYSPERPITVFRNGTLRILHLTELDGGNYLCLFQRPNGEDMELFQVDVLMTPPKIEHLRPTQPHVTYGQNFQVDCVATGLPNPEVSWSLPDGTVINNALQSDDSGVRNRRFVIFDNGTLLLQQMGKKDEGDYTCYAKNKLGEDEKKVSVKVAPNAPKIRPESHLLATARLGESANFVCQATGEPRPRILWISPGHHIISVSSDRYQVMENGILVVKRVTLADQGKYTCIARNPSGEDVKNFQMEVESQEPSINGAKGRSTSRVLAVSYQTTQLDCKAEGNPEPRVSWITPYGQQLPTPYVGGRFQVHRNGSLELRGVRKTDEGRYACMAKNTQGEATFWVELEVASIAEKPSFAVPNIEILPIKQDSGEIILKCPARGKPHPEFAWILPNRTMLPPGRALHRFVHYLGNGTLRISQPVANDKGVYRCVAKNVAGQAEKRYTLEAGRKPVIRGATGGMKITYGHSLYLPCSVDGWQQASISWTLPNGRLLDKPQNAGRVSFFANGTLQLKEVATFDKGIYVCKASNTFGSSTLSYPVTVMVYPPRITNAPASVTRVHRGSPVTLGCIASGVPKPEISWTLPGRTTLVPHDRFTIQGGIHMMEDGGLVIQNPMLTNSGIYTCNAKNALGTDFKSTYLQVI